MTEATETKREVVRCPGCTHPITMHYTKRYGGGCRGPSDVYCTCKFYKINVKAA